MPKPQYGAAHQRERRKWKRIVDAGRATCCLCGRPIPPGTAWDLDHEPGGTPDQYRGPACAPCNRSDGAIRGNNMRRGTTPPPRRWVL